MGRPAKGTWVSILFAGLALPRTTRAEVTSIERARQCLHSGGLLDMFTRGYGDREGPRCLLACPSGAVQHERQCVAPKVKGQAMELSLTIHMACGACVADRGSGLLAHMWLAVARFLRVPAQEVAASAILAHKSVQSSRPLERFTLVWPGETPLVSSTIADDVSFRFGEVESWDVFMAFRIHSERLIANDTSLLAINSGKTEHLEFVAGAGDFTGRLHFVDGAQRAEGTLRGIRELVSHFKVRALDWNELPPPSDAGVASQSNERTSPSLRGADGTASTYTSPVRLLLVSEESGMWRVIASEEVSFGPHDWWYVDADPQVPQGGGTDMTVIASIFSLVLIVALCLLASTCVAACGVPRFCTGTKLSGVTVGIAQPWVTHPNHLREPKIHPVSDEFFTSDYPSVAPPSPPPPNARPPAWSWGGPPGAKPQFVAASRAAPRAPLPPNYPRRCTARHSSDGPPPQSHPSHVSSGASWRSSRTGVSTGGESHESPGQAPADAWQTSDASAGAASDEDTPPRTRRRRGAARRSASEPPRATTAGDQRSGGPQKAAHAFAPRDRHACSSGSGSADGSRASSKADALIAELRSRLGEARGQPLAQRKRIFRELQLRLHPDKHMDSTEESEAAKLAFQQLMEQRDAYLAD